MVKKRKFWEEAKISLFNNNISLLEQANLTLLRSPRDPPFSVMTQSASPSKYIEVNNKVMGYKKIVIR